MRLRWGLSERSPGGPRYRAPYGAKNMIQCDPDVTKHNPMYLLKMITQVPKKCNVGE